MINRFITSRILSDLSFFPIVAITGPRQVGKTTLAKWLQGQIAKPSLYLDLELETDYIRLQDAETYLKSHQDKCVIIDEVQRMPQLFPLLRALVDQQRIPARFILLGSASPDLIRNSSEALTGRIAYVELTPFSLLEVHPEYSLQEHWYKGGFPVALTAPSSQNTARRLTNYITTFVERDLRMLGYQITPPVISRLLSMLTSIQGNLLNASDLARSMGVTHPTIKHYLDLLEGAYVISRLPPYFTNIGKRLVKSPKMYIRDSGILHQVARISSFEHLQGHILVGASWESYVIEQIRRVAGEGWEFYFYRTQVGAEADLVLFTPQGQMVCLEIKYSNAPQLSRGFYQTIEDLQPSFKYVLIPQGESYQKTQGITVCNLLDFLSEELPKLTEA